MQRPYFRLNYPSQAALDRLIAGEDLAGFAPELGMKLRPGHVVLAARYDADRAVGCVRAMGRVLSGGPRLSIDWRPIRFDVHPSGAGERFWRQDHFNFAPAVALRYALAERAASLFAGMPAAMPEAAAGSGQSLPG